MKAASLLSSSAPAQLTTQESVCDYAGRLVKIRKNKGQVNVIPGSTSPNHRRGYMGMIHQPDPEKRPDMFEGILAIRHMHEVAGTGFSTADEMLYPET